MNTATTDKSRTMTDFKPTEELGTKYKTFSQSTKDSFAKTMQSNLSQKQL